MPWRCPACRTEISHHPADPRPRTDEAYRCHVCRLELIFDAVSEKMVIAPFEADHHIEPPLTRRAIPVPALERRRARHK